MRRLRRNDRGVAAVIVGISVLMMFAFLGFAVGTRGADHNKSSAYEVDFSGETDRRHGDARSAELAIEPEDRAALFDSLILCKFLRGIFDDVWSESAAMMEAATGWDVSAEELRSTARRVLPPALTT